MTLAPGATVGRYQILEPLGQGGMATVYKAYQPSLDREVALKVLRPGYAQDAEFLERFEREAKSIAKLRHPNIVQVFDFELTDGQYALAMEFLEGGTLKEHLTQLAEQRRGLDPKETIRIVWEVADALSYAHELGIVHRDIKPSNVMLTRRDRAVVTDFGIARILGATSHTQTGVGIGTPEYMAPEQGQGGAIDHRADIYSLGAMAYEMLTGRVPYLADTPLAVVLAHMKDPLPLPSVVNPTIGKAVERALLRALAKDREQRFPSAIAFAEALRDGLAEDSTGGTVPTIVVRGTVAPATAAPARPAPTPAPKQVMLSLPPLLAQRPIVAGVATAVVLALVVGGVVASNTLRVSPQPSEPTSAATATLGPPAAQPASQPASTAGGQAPTPPPVTPTPVPTAEPPPRFAIPAKGRLLWAAKLDGVSRDLAQTYGGSGASGVAISEVPGAIELRVLPTGRESGGGEFAAPVVEGHVSEIEIAFEPGSDLQFHWDVRTARGGNRFYTVSITPRQLGFGYADKGGGSTSLIPPIQINASGDRPVVIAVVVQVPRFTLFVDQKQVAEVIDDQVQTADAPQSIWALPGDRGTVRITGARIYALP